MDMNNLITPDLFRTARKIEGAKRKYHSDLICFRVSRLAGIKSSGSPQQ